MLIGCVYFWQAGTWQDVIYLTLRIKNVQLFNPPKKVTWDRLFWGWARLTLSQICWVGLWLDSLTPIQRGGRGGDRTDGKPFPTLSSKPISLIGWVTIEKVKVWHWQSSCWFSEFSQFGHFDFYRESNPILSYVIISSCYFDQMSSTTL